MKAIYTVTAVTAYLTYSDGSELGEETAEYGIAYDDGDDVWAWSEGLGTADHDEALAVVTARGFTPTKVNDGWYGDHRDDSYRLDTAASLMPDTEAR